MSRIGAISSHSTNHTNRSKNSDSFRNKRVKQRPKENTSKKTLSSQQQIEKSSNQLQKTWNKDRAIYSATSCKTSATQVKKGIERRNGRLSKQAFTKENSTSRTSFRSFSLFHSNKKGEGASSNSLGSAIGARESVERSDKSIIMRRQDVASGIFNPKDLEQLKFHLTPKSIEDFLSSKEYQEWKANAIHNSLNTQAVNTQAVNTQAVKTQQSLLGNETGVMKPLQKPNQTVQNLAEGEWNQVKATSGELKLKCIIL